MTKLSEAQKYDEVDSPVEAVKAYEAAILNENANLETYLDLAVLYLNCTDFGYSSFHRIPVDLETGAYAGALSALSRAESKFGTHPEISFWKKYIPFKALGDSLSSEEVKQLVRGSRDSLVPFFFLFIESDGNLFREEAIELLRSVSEQKTSRQRYIWGILDGRV